MAACASACRAKVGAAMVARVAVTTVLRSIMAPLSRVRWDQNTAAIERKLLNKALWLTLAPGQRHQWHVVRIPFADRFRTGALERVFDRLGLAHRDMQAKQGHRDRIGPFREAQVAHRVEQDR